MGDDLFEFSVQHFRVEIQLYLRLSEIRDKLNSILRRDGLLLDHKLKFFKLIRLHDAVISGVR